MPELLERLVTARDYVSPNWTAAREIRVRASMERTRRAQARGRTLLTVAVTFAFAGVLTYTLFPREAPPQPSMAVSPAKPLEPTPLLELPDGSTVSRGSADARVQPVEVSARGVTLRLESGVARFAVMPDETRPFRVLAGNVTVTVLGTIFDVALEHDGVRVTVESGRVRVDSGSARSELSPGQSALFSGDSGAPPAPRDVDAKATIVPLQQQQPAAGPSWRALAQEGDYTRAAARLKSEGPAAVRDTPDDLLLAADVARLGGEPARAVAPLERVVTRHSGDSRAPLAAFTLGRTLLDQLGRPREAAEAFATSRKLAPAGALAQDALAREVESWARANEPNLARARAVDYVEAYPQGRRAASVRRLGGLD